MKWRYSFGLRSLQQNLLETLEYNRMPRLTINQKPRNDFDRSRLTGAREMVLPLMQYTTTMKIIDCEITCMKITYAESKLNESATASIHHLNELFSKHRVPVCLLLRVTLAYRTAHTLMARRQLQRLLLLQVQDRTTKPCLTKRQVIRIKGSASCPFYLSHPETRHL